jgi:hypothetical protein
MAPIDHILGQVIFKLMTLDNSKVILVTQGRALILIVMGQTIYDWESFNFLEWKTMPRGNPSSADGPITCLAVKANLSHWLREAVSTPPRSTGSNLSVVASSFAQPCPVPRNRIHSRLCGFRTRDMRPSNSTHQFNLIRTGMAEQS